MVTNFIHFFVVNHFATKPLRPAVTTLEHDLMCFLPHLILYSLHSAHVMLCFRKDKRRIVCIYIRTNSVTL
jgi:hypothetical protein